MYDQELVVYLSSLGLDAYASVLDEKGVKAQQLRMMSDNQLASLGLVWGDYLAIRRARGRVSRNAQYAESKPSLSHPSAPPRRPPPPARPSPTSILNPHFRYARRRRKTRAISLRRPNRKPNPSSIQSNR